MFHVLEHLADPYKTLRNLRQNSHAETRLVIEVPVIEKGFTNDLNGFLSIQHATHFSFNSLKLIMERAGWQILRWRDHALQWLPHRHQTGDGQSG